MILDFYEFLDNDTWIQKYILWELELFKNLGYDLELNRLVEKKIIGIRTIELNILFNNSFDIRYSQNFFLFF